MMRHIVGPLGYYRIAVYSPRDAAGGIKSSISIGAFAQVKDSLLGAIECQGSL